jgi:hypothetical protein
MRRKQKMSDETEEVVVTTATLIKALVLCNESRNRLTGFHSTPDFWILEAWGEISKSGEATSGER